MNRAERRAPKSRKLDAQLTAALALVEEQGRLLDQHAELLRFVLQERDEARAAVLALRDVVGHVDTNLDLNADAEKALADTESYEQYRK